VPDLSVLSEMPALVSVSIPWGARDVEKLRQLPKLRWISYLENEKTPQTAEQFWQMRKELPWFAELGAKGITATVERREDGLWSVEILRQPFADLAPLRGSPIWHLSIYDTQVADLEPLRGMPLESLRCPGTKVTDLAPLAGMPLIHLNISVTKVTDISLVRGMPLIEFQTHGGPPVDLAPFHEIDTLRYVSFSRGSKNIEGLRRLPRIERIGYGWDGKQRRIDTSAAEFWAAYDREKKP
jgi:hypothetical protein